MTESDASPLIPPRSVIEPIKQCRLLSCGGAALTIPIVTLHLLVGTLLWQRLVPEENLSAGDAFYMAVETFLTIGYGDITPASTQSKLYFIFFTLASLVVQLTVISTFLSSTVSLSPSHDSQGSEDSLATYFHVKEHIIKAVQGFFLLMVLIAAGAVLVRVSSTMGDSDPVAWIDCMYWSVTTISTVGYGDIVPQHWRPLFAVYFLLSVLLFAYILGECVSLVSEISRMRRLRAFFKEGLTMELIDMMDCQNVNSQVSRVEFLMFMLERLDVASQPQMDRIMRMFDAVDSNGDGVLDLRDVKHSLSVSSGTPQSTPIATSSYA